MLLRDTDRLQQLHCLDQDLKWSFQGFSAPLKMIFNSDQNPGVINNGGSCVASATSEPLFM